MHQQAMPPGRPGRTFHDQQLDSILRRLATEEDFVFLESARLTPENRRSLLFLRPERVLLLHPGDSPDDFFTSLEAELRRGRYLAGWFAYELGYLLEPRLRRLLRPDHGPLAVLGVYSAPLLYDHVKGHWRDGHDPLSMPVTEPTTDGGASRAHPTPPPIPSDPGLLADQLRRNLSGRQYRHNVEKIKRCIAAGDTYQVNYTLQQQLPCRGSAAALYRALRRNQRVPYAGWLQLAGQDILSLSPELFLRRQGNYCTVRPMKGTSRRGLTPEEDARLAHALPRDEKNRSENVMIVDLLRNDLGRVCQPGTVQTTELFTLESYETLFQMTSTIRGELRPEAGLAEIFRALFPCGSVTGAPKIRTMEIIHALEKEPRGVYTGAIGFISPRQEMVFNVPIRTVTMARQRAVMGIGSGIVYDSDPQEEWRECQLKGNFLSRPTPPFVLIETMLWQPGRGYRFLPLHRQRLLASARRLGFEADADEIKQLLARWEQTWAAKVMGPQRVRLTLAKDGTLALTAAPFQDNPCFDWPEPAGDRAQATAASLPTAVIAPIPMDPDQPLLYHKTSLRQVYDEQRQAALAAGHHEALFVNTRGELTEGAVSNIFVRLEGQLLTPPLAAGLLDGVLRRHLRQQKQPRLREQTLYPADLARAAAVYLGNSLRGLTQVRVV